MSIFGPGGILFTHPELTVMELRTPLDGFDVLVGLDMLPECMLILNGPQKQFTLAF